MVDKFCLQTVREKNRTVQGVATGEGAGQVAHVPPPPPELMPSGAPINNSSCGRQKGPSMMTRYARSYSLQKGPSLEDSVE